MDEHFKLFLWSAMTLGCLMLINSYFGFSHLVLFLVMLSAFAVSMIFVFHGHFLSYGMIVQVFFSAFVLVFAGMAIYYLASFGSVQIQ